MRLGSGHDRACSTNNIATLITDDGNNPDASEDVLLFILKKYNLFLLRCNSCLASGNGTWRYTLLRYTLIRWTSIWFSHENAVGPSRRAEKLRSRPYSRVTLTMGATCPIELQAQRQSSRLFLGKHGAISPRDLLRWAGRKPQGKQLLAEEG